MGASWTLMVRSSSCSERRCKPRPPSRARTSLKGFLQQASDGPRKSGHRAAGGESRGQGGARGAGRLCLREGRRAAGSIRRGSKGHRCLLRRRRPAGERDDRARGQHRLVWNIDAVAGVLAPAGDEQLRDFALEPSADTARALADGQSPATLKIFLHEALDKGVDVKESKTPLQVVEAGGSIAWVIVALGLVALVMIVLRGDLSRFRRGEHGQAGRAHHPAGGAT